MYVNDQDCGSFGLSGNKSFSTSILDPNAAPAPSANLGLTQFEYSRGDINDTRYMNKYVNVLSSDTDVDTYKSNFDYDAFVKNYKVFTDTATQVNKGIVTMYPFMIGSYFFYSSRCICCKY